MHCRSLKNEHNPNHSWVSGVWRILVDFDSSCCGAQLLNFIVYAGVHLSVFACYVVDVTNF